MDIKSVNCKQAAGVMRFPSNSDSKYSRGTVALAVGSDKYPGAAVLCANGAILSGAGYVRYYGSERCSNMVLISRPETVLGAGKADAWVVGSGVADIENDFRREFICSLICSKTVQTDSYVAINAGALPIFAQSVAQNAKKHSDFDSDIGKSDSKPDNKPDNGRFVITPHCGEAAKIFAQFGIDVSHEQISAQPVDYATKLSNLLGCCVILKGGQTVIAHERDVFKITCSTHWLATAGTGDVLAGIAGTILAQNAQALRSGSLSLAQAASAAVWIHSVAGSIAANDEIALHKTGLIPDSGNLSSGHPISAMDVAEHIGRAVEISLTVQGNISINS